MKNIKKYIPLIIVLVIAGLGTSHAPFVEMLMLIIRYSLNN